MKRIDKRAVERARRLLRDARQLIKNKDNWIQGKLYDENFESFCAVGAVQHLGEKRHATVSQELAKTALNRAADELYGYSSIISVNDENAFNSYKSSASKEESHKRVLKAFTRAQQLVGRVSREETF